MTQEIEATKSKTEKEDEEANRLVRPPPQKKPPRKDRQRNRVKEDDPTVEDLGAEGDRDLSMRQTKRAAPSGNSSIRSHQQNPSPIMEFSLMDKTAAEKAKTARELEAKFDALAEEMTERWAEMGVDENEAREYCLTCDKLADQMSAFAVEQEALAVTERVAAARAELEEATKAAAAVLQRQPDEKYVDTFNGPGHVKTQPDEPYVREHFQHSGESSDQAQSEPAAHRGRMAMSLSELADKLSED